MPRWPVALALAFCIGCGAGRPSGPQQLVGEYIAAIRADDARKAYALLAEPSRRKLTESEFATRWRDLRPELLEQARQLEARLKEPIGARADLRYAEGVSAGLTFAGAWRIDAGVAVTPPAASPIEAVSALVRALEHRSYDALLKLLARPLRKTLDAETAERLERLKAWLKTNPEVEITGDRARVRYDPRFRLELVNEDGQWRVIDYN